MGDNEVKFGGEIGYAIRRNTCWFYL
jgi:hypothetical protein